MGAVSKYHSSEQPSIRIFSRYCDSSQSWKRIALASYFPPRCAMSLCSSNSQLIPRKDTLEDSSRLGLSRGLRSCRRRRRWRGLVAQHAHRFTMTGAQRTPNQMCPSFVHDFMTKTCNPEFTELSDWNYQRFRAVQL